MQAADFCQGIALFSPDRKKPGIIAGGKERGQKAASRVRSGAAVTNDTPISRVREA